MRQPKKEKTPRRVGGTIAQATDDIRRVRLNEHFVFRDVGARKLSNEVRMVADRAEREARAKEPVVGTEMGGKKRLGDADITTSPRD